MILQCNVRHLWGQKIDVDGTHYTVDLEGRAEVKDTEHARTLLENSSGWASVARVERGPAPVVRPTPAPAPVIEAPPSPPAAAGPAPVAAAPVPEAPVVPPVTEAPAAPQIVAPPAHGKAQKK